MTEIVEQGKSDLIELAMRCKRATGPDGQLDDAIFELVMPDIYRSQSETLGVHSPDYTASIDAAMTLVPEGWFVANLAQWRSGAPSRTWAVTLKLDPYCDDSVHTSNKPSAALALCVAALLARATPVSPAHRANTSTD